MLEFHVKWIESHFLTILFSKDDITKIMKLMYSCAFNIGLLYSPQDSHNAMEGYVVAEGRPLREHCLPCYKIGLGWFLWV